MDWSTNVYWWLAPNAKTFDLLSTSENLAVLVVAEPRTSRDRCPPLRTKLIASEVNLAVAVPPGPYPRLPDDVAHN